MKVVEELDLSSMWLKMECRERGMIPNWSEFGLKENPCMVNVLPVPVCP